MRGIINTLLFTILTLATTFVAAGPTFPACGTITTLKNANFTLHNAGRTDCQPLTVNSRQPSPKTWDLVEFCTCRFYYGSEMAKPCSSGYLWHEIKGPSTGAFGGLRVADYECWNPEAGV